MDDMTEKIQSILSDEESMQQIKELAAMLGVSPDDSAANASPPPFSSSDLDPAVLLKLSAAFNSDDKYCSLLYALKPLLSEERQLKADRAIKMLRLYNVYTVLKNSGMLNDLGLS